MTTSRPPLERVHDLLHEDAHPLDPIFSPRTVAVIGATETVGSVGRTLLWNLVTSPFGGTVFPVNPKRANVLGIRAHANVLEVPGELDLAVIATPAKAVPAVLEDCVRKGVKGAIVISAGFTEMGPEGDALAERALHIARRGRMRLVGPNCLGVMNPLTGMNATFAKGMARPGNLAFVSQSGALCTAVLDWSLQEQIGFSAFVSVGSMLDVGFGDLIDYLGRDQRTGSILVYMESVGDARAFLSAAREVALNKPIIVIKAGRTEQAAKAAASHTGTLAGSDAVLDAAFRRVGVLRVEHISELFSMAEVLGKQPRPRGRRLAIVTNAGGPGVLATDALVRAGGELATLSRETHGALDDELPPQWSRNNPVDVLGDAGPERYVRAASIVARDPGADGLLVILTPQDMTDPTGTAEALRRLADLDGKPILASFMGGPDVSAGVDILNRAGIPTYPYPDSAARAFEYMWRYTYHLRGLYETPSLHAEGQPPKDHDAVAAVTGAARKRGHTILTEHESKALLEAYGIPVVTTRIARDADEAIMHAADLGYPVVLKLLSQTVTHKSDVGGVHLDLGDHEEVATAFAAIRANVTRAAGRDAFDGVTVQPMVRTDGIELILGSSVDPQFGPVLLFGAGGRLVEIMQDRALALPPLNATLARRMMEQTRIFQALLGTRGMGPVDMDALEALLVRFSQLVVEHPAIREIDVNPLLASSRGLVALDARVVLYDMSVAERDLPRPAIRPYPTEHVGAFVAHDGTNVILRPLRPEDEPYVARFHEELSDETVRQRYFRAFTLGHRVAHDRLSRVCFLDYDRDMALVAVREADVLSSPEVLGIGRLTRTPGVDEGEISLLIGDRWQGRGLGTELLRRLVAFGRGEGLSRLFAEMLRDNVRMQRVLENAGFRLRDRDGGVVGELLLNGEARRTPASQRPPPSPPP